MNKNEYAQAVAKKVDGEVREVEKANGIRKVAILAGEGSIIPTIYVDDDYENGTPVDVMAEIIRRVVNEQKQDFDIESIKNFEAVKGKLRLRLYNEATKADIYERAEDFDDLIVIPYVEDVVKIEDGTGSVKVNNRLLEVWGVSKAEVMKIARENSSPDKYNIKTMTEVLRELMGKAVAFPDGDIMLVIS